MFNEQKHRKMVTPNPSGCPGVESSTRDFRDALTRTSYLLPTLLAHADRELIGLPRENMIDTRKFGCLFESIHSITEAEIEGSSLQSVILADWVP